MTEFHDSSTPGESKEEKEKKRDEKRGPSQGSRLVAQGVCLLLAGGVFVMAYQAAAFASHTLHPPSLIIPYLYLAFLGLGLVPFAYAIPFRLPVSSLALMGAGCLGAIVIFQYALYPLLSFSTTFSHGQQVLHLFQFLLLGSLILSFLTLVVREKNLLAGLISTFITPLAVVGAAFLPFAFYVLYRGDLPFQFLLRLPAFLALPIIVALFWQFDFFRRPRSLRTPFRYYLQAWLVFFVLLLGSSLLTYMITQKTASLHLRLRSLYQWGEGRLASGQKWIQKDRVYLVVEKKGISHLDILQLQPQGARKIAGLPLLNWKARFIAGRGNRLLFWIDEAKVYQRVEEKKIGPGLYFLRYQPEERRLVWENSISLVSSSQRERREKNYSSDSTFVAAWKGDRLALLHSPYSRQFQGEAPGTLQFIQSSTGHTFESRPFSFVPRRAPRLALSENRLYMALKKGVSIYPLKREKKGREKNKPLQPFRPYEGKIGKFFTPQKAGAITSFQILKEGKSIVLSWKNDKNWPGTVLLGEMKEKDHPSRIFYRPQSRIGSFYSKSLDFLGISSDWIVFTSSGELVLHPRKAWKELEGK